MNLWTNFRKIPWRISEEIHGEISEVIHGRLSSWIPEEILEGIRKEITEENNEKFCKVVLGFFLKNLQRNFFKNVEKFPGAIPKETLVEISKKKRLKEWSVFRMIFFFLKELVEEFLKRSLMEEIYPKEDLLKRSLESL